MPCVPWWATPIGNTGNSAVLPAAVDSSEDQKKTDEPPARRDPRDEDPFGSAARAARAFLFPFLFSFALAYIGSVRAIDWMHFVGLGGVGLSMIGLMIWLIH